MHSMKNHKLKKKLIRQRNEIIHSRKRKSALKIERDFSRLVNIEYQLKRLFKII